MLSLLWIRTSPSSDRSVLRLRWLWTVWSNARGSSWLHQTGLLFAEQGIWTCDDREKIQITSDTEDGNHVTVTGRSLESILDRRIVWGQKLLSGNLQNGIKTLLNENVISPSDSNRKIPNFIFKESTDPAITKLKLEAQYTGDNLYDVIQKICEEQGIGFKITLNDEKQFVFELYAGSDRSYDQTENPTLYFHRNSRTSSIVTTSNLKLRWRQWPWLVEKVRAPIEDILRLVVALVWIAENCLRTLVTFLQMLEAMMRWPMPSIWHSCSKEEKKSLLKMWALPHSRRNRNNYHVPVWKRFL